MNWASMRFSHDELGASAEREVGACHALDVPLTFGVLDSDLARMLLGAEPPPEAEALSA